MVFERFESRNCKYGIWVIVKNHNIRTFSCTFLQIKRTTAFNYFKNLKKPAIFMKRTGKELAVLWVTI